MLRSTCCTGLFALLFTTLSYAQDPSPTGNETVAREVTLEALQTNPEVQAQWQAFKAADYDMRGARGGYLPSLDVTAGTGRQSRDFDGRGTYDTNRAEVSLTQMLFDGFATRGEVLRLDGARQVRFFELLGSIDSVSQAAIEAQEDVVRYRQLVELARENYQQHLSVQRQIDDRVSQGVGRRADLDQVQGRVALAESNLLTEASNLHDVTARYLRIVGQLPPEGITAPGLRANRLPGSLQDVLWAAYEGNPAFHAAIKNIEAAEGAVKRDRAGYMPRVELRARHGTQQNLGIYDERFDDADFGDDSSVELALTYNLFNGGANRSAVRSSLAEVNQAKAERDQACINLRQEVQIAHNALNRLQEQLVALRRHRDAINSVRGAYTEQFQIGQRTLLDLLDAENEYFQASRSLINAEHDLNIAHTRLLSLTGTLLPALDLTRDQLSTLGSVDDDLGDIEVRPSAVCPMLAPRPLPRESLISEVITLDISELFSAQSSQLDANATGHLASLLRQWQRDGDLAAVDIIAYNATSSSAKVNQTLAQARADAVKNYLLLNGLQVPSLEAEGRGVDTESAPVITSANSRIEITLRKTSS